MTPSALINDRARRLQPLRGRALLDFELLNYHLLTNAATMTIAALDLIRLIEACGHPPAILDLEATRSP